VQVPQLTLGRYGDDYASLSSSSYKPVYHAPPLRMSNLQQPKSYQPLDMSGKNAFYSAPLSYPQASGLDSLLALWCQNQSYVWRCTLWQFCPSVCLSLHLKVITALHAMQTRSSDENSVRPSVCLSVRHKRALW